jgi:hypothetical protein
MAALPVEIRGTLYDLQSKSSRQVYIVGDAIKSGVGIGGGPVIPPSGGNGDHIWGPTDPRPTHPIAGIPGLPGYIPPIPTEPPPSGGDKPPPEDSGGWGFVAEWSRWGYFPAEGEAQPK